MSSSKTVPAGTPNDGLPSSWKAIVDPVIAAPLTPPAAFSSGSPSPQFAASIPLSSQLVPDMMPTRYPGGMGGYRIFPPPPAANALNNAAIKSIIDNTPCCAPPAVPLPFGGTVVVCGNYEPGAGNDGELIVFQCPPAGAPIPFTDASFCYNGTLPLQLGFTVPAGGLLPGDLIIANISVYNLGNPLGNFTDNLGNTSTPLFNRVIASAFSYTNAAGYIAIGGPVAAGTGYIVTVNGLAASTTGEVTIQGWRNLGTPQLSEIVFTDGVSPYSTLNPSITTSDSRTLLIFEGTIVNGSLPADWLVPTPKVSTFWPAPQMYWNNGTTSVAPPGTYSPSFTCGTGGYGAAIVPFK